MDSNHVTTKINNDINAEEIDSNYLTMRRRELENDEIETKAEILAGFPLKNRNETFASPPLGCLRARHVHNTFVLELETEKDMFSLPPLACFRAPNALTSTIVLKLPRPHSTPSNQMVKLACVVRELVTVERSCS